VKAKATVEGVEQETRIWTNWQMYKAEDPTKQILNEGIDEEESDLPTEQLSAIGPIGREAIHLTKRLPGKQGRWQREAERMLGVL
jgi:hypothetical protein